MNAEEIQAGAKAARIASAIALFTEQRASAETWQPPAALKPYYEGLPEQRTAFAAHCDLMLEALRSLSALEACQRERDESYAMNKVLLKERNAAVEEREKWAALAEGWRAIAPAHSNDHEHSDGFEECRGCTAFERSEELEKQHDALLAAGAQEPGKAPPGGNA